MYRSLTVALLVALGTAPLVAQQTRPERTRGAETSTHADVLAFLDSLSWRGAAIRVGTLGTSPEGRRIPWVLAARPMIDNPGDAQRSGKPIVYIQGNIHAGEVEGKEALQALLRDLTLGALKPLLDSVILLVVPIYNSDGNERFAPGDRNRPGQNGPALVGRRANGQNYDLNRDYVKLEAPESRGSLALIDQWQPDLFIDLHTTNGSYHGYALTWSPGLNANRTPANDYTQHTFLPLVRERVLKRDKVATFPYGNFRNQDPDSLILGWETYDGRARYGVNNQGLTGRIAILSEAYSNDPLERRIEATYWFVREILSLAAEQRTTIRQLVQRSAAHRPDSIVVRSQFAPPLQMEVIAELTELAGEGSGMYARRKRTGQFKTIRMPVFDRFIAQEQVARPAGYLLPPSYGTLVPLLRVQGIVVERLSAPWSGDVEAFRPESVQVAPFAFEGHRTVTLKGAWKLRPASLTPGWYYVPTDQRLGVLAAVLLEPGSEDGFLTWNFFDRELRPNTEVPVLRVRTPIAVPRELMP
jgi:hypothetical protein